MQLTIRSILDIRYYVEAICVSNAILLMIALAEMGKVAKVTDLTDHIIVESRGKIRVRDQSARNSLKKLIELEFVDRLSEKKGKRTVYSFRLTEKGDQIIKALTVFVEEVRRQVNKSSS